MIKDHLWREAVSRQRDAVLPAAEARAVVPATTFLAGLADMPSSLASEEDELAVFTRLLLLVLPPELPPEL